ncbi:MAG: DUF1566 domain-containing protein [Sulfurovum sp.]|nr:MAG: DUF1566 domain-containing protein [Sulfurovum sp.]
MFYRFMSKYLFVMLLSLSNSFLYAEEAISVTWKPPVVNFEVSIDTNGEIDITHDNTFVTPIGVFSLGVSTNLTRERNRYQKNFTYVEIKNSNKVYIYKVNHGKKLTVKSRGRTNIEITKNRVTITIMDKKSFKISFDLIGANKWITPTKTICERYGGKMDDGLCDANWYDAQRICEEMDARLATIHELKKLVKDCSKNPSNYKSCYQNKGFSNSPVIPWYWSSSLVEGKMDSQAWLISFESSTELELFGSKSWISVKSSPAVQPVVQDDKKDNNYVRCLK